MAYEHSLMFVEGQKHKNKDNDELKKELMSLRKDYDVEIKAMFLELNRVKEELSQLRDSSDINDRNGKNDASNYFDNPLNQSRQNSTQMLTKNVNLNPNTVFEKKTPNARYNGNKNELQYAEGNGSSLGSSLFEYSSRSRIYGD